MNYPDQQRKNINTASTTGIIGGVRSLDPWKTTATQMNNPNPQKKSSAIRRLNIPSTVSPITGEEILPKLAPATNGNGSLISNSLYAKYQDEDLPLVAKLRADLIARGGGNGIANLARKFRIIDDDDSKTLSMSEFTKAMKETSVNFSDDEIRQLFRTFDKSGKGQITYDEFLQTLAGRLNERRMALVQMAYDVLDADGSGTVDIDDFKLLYDVSYHPDYISKRKTKDEILRELIDVFDVGGEKDGVVTRKEFTNYYSSLSASIDDDDYFELMIRNAWHISGGTGAAANSTNKRLLVTNKDGEERVVELQNDFCVKPNDKAEISRRLQLQLKQEQQQLLLQQQQQQQQLQEGSQYSSLNIDLSGRVFDRPESEFPSKELIKLAPKPALSSAQRYFTTSSSIGSKSVNNQSNNNKKDATTVNLKEYDNQIKSILNAMKRQLCPSGDCTPLINFSRRLNVTDITRTGTISLVDLQQVLKKSEINLSPSDLKILYNYIGKSQLQYLVECQVYTDVKEEGKVIIAALIGIFKGDMNEKRKNLVTQVFRKIDGQGKGRIDPLYLIQVYDSSKHPEVCSRKRSVEAVRSEFLATFHSGSDIPGTVTLNDFLSYYGFLSAVTESDDYFELLLRSVWNLPSTPLLDNIISNLGADSSDVNTTYQAPSLLNHLLCKNGGRTLPDVQTKVLDTIRSDNNARTIEQIASDGPNYKNCITVASAMKFPDTKSQLDPGISCIISKLQEEVKMNGFHGFVHLQRLFWSFDADHSNTLDLSEFKNAFKDVNYGLNLQERDIQRLFAYFDADRNGAIDMAEFMDVIRIPMSATRKEYVNAAFDKLDNKKEGIIDADDLAKNFNASQHPEVLAGRTTIDNIYREFLENFDVGHVLEGKVTKDEFLNYYENINSSILNDEYFYLMIRNTWNVVDTVNTRAKDPIDNNSGMLNRLRSTMDNTSQSKHRFSNEMGSIEKAAIQMLRKQAVQMFSQRKYSEAKRMYEAIRDKYIFCDVDISYPEYLENEKNIAACVKRSTTIN